ncbi:helix-turn-helix domain-containing protein [Nonomuraea sp. GTA35]|uniref:helix-turn-helix domain-containing protein n=1 Tax=Nonomuraea sp. GTA35 TaxID=1676746 RepID=UPI0035C13371
MTNGTRSKAGNRPANDLLTSVEVADRFRVDFKTVNRWADAGKVPCFRTPGGQRRFHRGDIDALAAGHTDRTLATLAHLVAVRTGLDGAVLHHALYAVLLASELQLAPAEADDRAADPAWSDAERAVNDRARALIEQARQATRAAEFAQGDEDETADQHRARTGHSPNFGCCVTDAERDAATQRWETELTQDGAR